MPCLLYFFTCMSVQGYIRLIFRSANSRASVFLFLSNWFSVEELEGEEEGDGPLEARYQK